MGIINVTPDSFYDGGATTHIGDILAQAKQMLAAGATFLDVGGYSSRPGAVDISEEEELERVIPAINSILNEYPDAIISIDTFRSEVAKKAIETGAAMVNDISSGQYDSNMMAAVAQLGVPYVMMHMRGTPQTMQTLTEYKNITKEVLFYFSERLAAARKAKINDILVDPGFGFAKTTDQNFKLLGRLELFEHLDVPVLVGVSRKSMIYKTLDGTAQTALNGTTALHSIALAKGAQILRVHDVTEAMECVALSQKLKSQL